MTYSYSSHTQGDYSRKVWKGWTVETHRGEKNPSKSLFGSTAGGSWWSTCYCCEWNTESFSCNWKYDKALEVSQKNFKEKRHKNHLSISITWQSQSLLLFIFLNHLSQQWFVSPAGIWLEWRAEINPIALRSRFKLFNREDTQAPIPQRGVI